MKAKEAQERTEAEIQNAILLKHGREPDVTLWRQNTGVHKSEIATRAHLERLFTLLTTAHGEHRFRTNAVKAAELLRSLLAEQDRFTRYGLCEGSSDIVGIVQTRECIHRPQEIGYDLNCEDKFGIFLALEVKRHGKKPTDVQQIFLDLVNRRGGVGRCVHSEDEAGAAIEEARCR